MQVMRLTNPALFFANQSQMLQQTFVSRIVSTISGNC